MKARTLIVFIVGIALGILAVAAFFLLWHTKPQPVPVAQKPVSSHEKPPPQKPLSARVRVSEPKAGASVSSTFAAKGEVPGNWFFEASFPVQVRDKDGSVIGRGIAQAKSNWMTTAQVPFEASIALDSSYHGPATLILLKNNPSGLPENDDSVSFGIVVQ